MEDSKIIFKNPSNYKWKDSPPNSPFTVLTALKLAKLPGSASLLVVVVVVNGSQNISGSFSLGLSLPGKGWNGSFSLKGSEESNLLVGLFPGSKSLQLTQLVNTANMNTQEHEHGKHKAQNTFSISS